MNEGINIVSAVFAFFSGVMWWVSSRNVMAKDSGLTDDLITDGGVSIVGTLKNQSKWNSWAAICAGIAAFLQSISLFIG